MVVLGIILLLIAAAAFVAALFGGAGDPTFDLGPVDIAMNTFSVYLVGAVTVVIAVAGLGLIQAGMRRARQRHQQKKELKRVSKKLAAQESQDAKTTGTTEATPPPETRTDTAVTDRERPNP